MSEKINLDWLIARVRAGEDVTNTIVDGVACLSCGNPLTGVIQSTGAHQRDCPWNYYFSCLFCNYQSNLAKFASKTHPCVCG